MVVAILQPCLTQFYNLPLLHCAVTNATPQVTLEDKRGSDFQIEMDVDYSRRSLVTAEQTVLNTVFEKCCQSDTSCLEWKKVAPRNGGMSSNQDLFLDFCHWDQNVCDDEGFLLRLNMQGFGMECQLPAHQIVQLSKLQKLQLGNNKMTGDVNSVMAELQALNPSLQHLGLHNNRLNGSLSSGGNASDASVCSLVHASLFFLDLSNNNVTGPILNCLFDSDSQLEDLDLSGNPLASRLTVDFTDSRIRVLEASNTQLFGEIPASLALSEHLQIIDLSRNSLQGLLPIELGQSKVLEFADFSSNRLKGMIPGTLVKSPRLKTLLLAQNNFAALPEEWVGDGAASRSLVLVDLGENRLRGKFPTPLARALSIRHLSIGTNLMHGELPDEASLFPTGTSVNLSYNEFSGPVPKQWLSIGMLDPMPARNREDRNSTIQTTSVLDLSHNELTGGIPFFMINAAETGQVDILLAGNKMTCPTSAKRDTVLGIECAEMLDVHSDGSGSGANSDGLVSDSSGVSGGVALASESEVSDSGSGKNIGSSLRVSILVVMGIVAVAIAAVLYRFIVRYRYGRRHREIGATETDYWPRSLSGDMGEGGQARRADLGCSGGPPCTLSELVVLAEPTDNAAHHRKKSQQRIENEDARLIIGPTSG